MNAPHPAPAASPLTRKRPALLIALPAIGLVWLLLAVHSLSVGGVTWDELFDFEGVNGAFWHGINWLKGARPDLHTITFDLEYFGNATRWPTYLLWRLLNTQPWESFTTLSRPQIVLSSGYIGLNHLNAIVFALLGIGLTALLGIRLGGRRAGLLAGALLLLLPTWLGHGWMNSKDIPMATSYLLYTLGSTLLLQKRTEGGPLRLLGIGLMAGSRVSSLMFIALTEAVLSPWLRRAQPRRWLGSLGGGLLLGFLLTPQAWGNPFGYPLEAMSFIGDRQSSGDPLASLRYCADHLLDLLPSPLLLGLLLAGLLLPGLAAICLARPDGADSSGMRQPGPLVVLLPTLLQLLIPPLLLVVGGKMLYNELRHLLMIQPPLCVLGGLGYGGALEAIGPAAARSEETKAAGPCEVGAQPMPRLRSPWPGRLPRAVLRTLLLLAAASSLVLILELLLLSPYQYAYRSDLARLLEAGRQAPLRSDYWGFSNRETISRCLKREPCAALLARLPLAVDGRSFNPELIEASASLLRPQQAAGPEGRLLISTDPSTANRLGSLAATERLTLLPRPRRNRLSTISLAPGTGGAAP